MPLYIDLDFETASAADLKVCGAWAYAEHPTTEILCLVYEPNEEGKARWFPGQSVEFLADWAADPSVIFVAHNAGFEQAIWACIMVPVFGLPPLPPERWEDTMATAAWKAIPLALDKGARALDLDVQKDREGNRLTLSMSKFRTKKDHIEHYPGQWWGTKKAWEKTFKKDMFPERTPERMDRIAAYCERDVEVETAVRCRIGLLSEQSPRERDVWLYDQRINQRGVRIDLDFVRQAQLVIERASKSLLTEFRDLTAGINPTQRDKVMAWATSQGVELENLRKEYLEELLGEEDDDDDVGYVSNAVLDNDTTLLPSPSLPVSVRRVLEIRQMLGSASIKKLARMRACVCEDGRVRGLLQYHAAGTGRWGGRLLQPQNFPRGVLKVSPEMAVAAIMTGDPEFVEAVLGVPAIAAVASSLRHALIPDPGKVFLVGDYAGIEARIDLALAGQHDKTAMMAAGEDVYLDMACDIFNVPKGSLTKADVEKRQTGKNSVLGCGFQMGWRTFQARYCQDRPDEFAQGVVNAYRKVWAPEVPKLWYGLDDAALKAVKTGRAVSAYGVTYKPSGDGWMTAKLPSGWQTLWYPLPKLGRDERFDRECWSYSAFKGGKEMRTTAYGGLLTENAVQGLARGLLCAAIDRLERAGLPVVLTVHDEAVCEVDEGRADVHEFEQLMAEPTRWARDIQIPIAVEAWAGDRYRK